MILLYLTAIMLIYLACSTPVRSSDDWPLFLNLRPLIARPLPSDCLLLPGASLSDKIQMAGLLGRPGEEIPRLQEKEHDPRGVDMHIT